MNTTDDIISKIKKAMRLAAKAATEGERVAAENAAHRLAAANGINLSEVTITDSEIKAVMKDGDKKYARCGAEVGFAIDIINRHFGVIIMRWVNPKDHYAKYTFFGVNINIEIAKYVYDILLREFHKDFRQCKGWGLKKRAFMTGWFMQIDRKLKERPIRNDREQFEEERKSAVKKFEEFKSQYKDGMREQTTKADRSDSEALYRGFEAARHVNLSRPCEGRESQSPFALGHTAQLKGGL